MELKRLKGISVSVLQKYDAVLWSLNLYPNYRCYPILLNGISQSKHVVVVFLKLSYDYSSKIYGHIHPMFASSHA